MHDQKVIGRKNNFFYKIQERLNSWGTTNKSETTRDNWNLNTYSI